MTPNENTLQIKDFAGIDRFARGTVTPPNRFWQLQNMHPISRGELWGILGVEDISPNQTFPGVDEIVHTAFHTDTEGVTRLLAFFRPDVDSSTTYGLSNFTSANFSATGGSPAQAQFLIVGVGPAGIPKSTTVTIVSLNDGNVTVTIPNNLPDYVAQVDIYEALAGSYSYPDPVTLIGSVHRRGGVFPASITMPRARGTTYASSNSTLCLIVPRRFSVGGYTTNGSLVANKTYYVGIAPLMAPHDSDKSKRLTRVRLSDAQTQFMTFQMANNANSAWIYFAFPARPPGSGANTLQAGGTDVTRYCPFIGATPEDMSWVGDTTNGAIVSIPNEEWSATFLSASAADNTVTLDSGAGSLGAGIQDGDPVFLYSSTPGNLPGGLTNNTVYWIKYASFSGSTVKFATSKANLDAGVFVDITTNGSTYSSHGVYVQKCRFEVKELPYNTRNNVHMIDDYANEPRLMGGTEQSAEANRYDGTFTNIIQIPQALDPFWADGSTIVSDTSAAIGYTGQTPSLGCWVIPSLPFDSSTAWQLLPGINERGFSRFGSNLINDKAFFSTPLPSPNLLWLPEDNQLSTEQFTIRTYIANGDNSYWYTNGYVLKAIVRDDGSTRIPTTKFIRAFQNRLTGCGGDNSFQNSPNQLYYSDIENPFNWGTTINTLNVFSPQPFSGLGAYSQNLLDSGFNDFLIISKKDSIFTWDGDTNKGPKQIYKSFGFASPNAFAVTDQGPVFVARDNVYTVQGELIPDIGDEVRDILQALSDEQLAKINVVFQERYLKIGYPSSTGGCDRELWMELRNEEGGLQRFWSGPHVLKEYTTQAVALNFNGQRDVRISALGSNIYQRDIGYLNDNADIVRSIVVNRLGLRAEHFWKLLTQIYLSIQISQDEEFDITLEYQNGSTTLSFTKEALFSEGDFQLLQSQLTERSRGRIVSLTITNESDGPVSIFDVSLLFEQMNRRLLR